METKKKYVKLFACYVLWGFQPLYWTLLKEVDPYTILAVRIVFAAVFSVLLLFASGKISLLSSAFRDKRQMKFLAPAALILLADWTVFIIVVNNGHVLDASLGYYICPLVVFAVGIVLFHEKAKKLQIAALAVAAAGVVVCAVSLGDIPAVSLFLAVNWAVYSSIKKYVHLEGIVSIAVETLLMLPAAIFFSLCSDGRSLSVREA